MMMTMMIRRRGVIDEGDDGNYDCGDGDGIVRALMMLRRRGRRRMEEEEEQEEEEEYSDNDDYDEADDEDLRPAVLYICGTNCGS